MKFSQLSLLTALTVACSAPTVRPQTSVEDQADRISRLHVWGQDQARDDAMLEYFRSKITREAILAVIRCNEKRIEENQKRIEEHEETIKANEVQSERILAQIEKSHERMRRLECLIDALEPYENDDTITDEQYKEICEREKNRCRVVEDNVCDISSDVPGSDENVEKDVPVEVNVYQKDDVRPPVTPVNCSKRFDETRDSLLDRHRFPSDIKKNLQDSVRLPINK